MADGILTLTGFSDFKRLLAEYRKLDAANDKLKQQLEGVGKESKKTDKSHEDMASMAIKRVTQMAAGYVSLRTMIQLATAALADHKTMTAKAAEQQTKLSDAQVGLLTMTGFGNQQDQLKFQQRAQQKGLDLHIGEIAGNVIATKILSATTGNDLKQRGDITFGIMDALGPYFRNPAIREAGGDLGGAIVDLVRATPGLDPKTATAAIMAMTGQARITEFQNARNLVRPAVAMALQFPSIKDRKQLALEGLAISSFLGSVMGDPTGELTQTAGASVGTALHEVTENAKRFPQLQGMGLVDRLAWLARPENKKIADKVRKEFKGRSFSKIPQGALLEENREALEGQMDRLFVLGGVKEVLKNLEEATPAAMDAKRRMVERGTPEILAENIKRDLGHKDTSRLRKTLQQEGTTRELLFGGGEEAFPGFFRSQAKGQGNFIQEYIQRKAAELAFDISKVFRMSDEEAGLNAMAAANLIQPHIGPIQLREQGERLRQIERASPHNSMLNEMQRNTAEGRRAADAADRAAGAANAAANLNHQKE